MSELVTIQHPKAGEAVVQGETYRVYWHKTGTKPTDTTPVGIMVTAMIEGESVLITHIAPDRDGPKVGDGPLGSLWSVPIETASEVSTVSSDVILTLYYGSNLKLLGTSGSFTIIAPRITILTPAQDEQIRVGREDYAITWTADENYTAGEMVHIYLVEKYDNYEIRQTELTDATEGVEAIAGVFTFDVSEVFSGQAVVKIIDRRSDGTEIVFTSEEFELVDRSLYLIETFDENIIWYEGGSYTLDWQAFGFDADDKLIIKLHDNDADRSDDAYTPLVVINDVLASEGTYEITLPNSLGNHSVFLELLDQVDGHLYAFSEVFSIQQRSISFIAPNRGTVWYGGKTRSIEWTRYGFAGTEAVTLAYSKDGGDWQTIPASGVEVQDETFAWSLQEGGSDLDDGVYRVQLVCDGLTFTSDSFYIADLWLDFGKLKTRTMLVTVANNRLWYEDIDDNRTMKPVTDFYGEEVILQPQPRVALIPAFQKVYICDGTFQGFYKLDLVNIRIQGTVPTGVTFLRGATLTQTATGAQAVFDEAVQIDGQWYFYMYRSNGNSFSSDPAAIISGDGRDADGELITVELTITAASTIVEPPHWLDWALAADDSKGSLPESASIGCLYRGRIVLAGNKNAPHQWYMARQGDPLDFLYIEGDAQSAIAGSQGDAGEVGDILTALIPAHDDYLIFGCAHEMWLLRGDAAAGGSLDILTNADGVFGPQAWCFDGSNRLYYMGTGGMYRLLLGESGPENLTATKLPEFLKGISRQTHNIIMAYDRKRIGILIAMVCITEGDDYGKGQTWWYDLKTEGFFPERYLNGQVPFSLHDYGAQDGSYEHLLLGFHDGFIRCFDETARSDTTADDLATAINSYVVYPPQPLAALEYDSKLTELSITTGGEPVATDAVTLRAYLAATAQQALDASLADTTPAISRTVTGTGRASPIRQKCRGRYLALKLANSNANETFAIEMITATAETAGRLRY